MTRGQQCYDKRAKADDVMMLYCLPGIVIVIGMPPLVCPGCMLSMGGRDVI